MSKEPDFMLLNTFLLCAVWGCPNISTYGKEFDNEPGKVYPMCVDHRGKYGQYQLKLKPKYSFEKSVIELIEEPKDASDPKRA